MSCYIVSDKQVILITSIYKEHIYEGIKIHREESLNVVSVANELLAANYTAYNERYKEEGVQIIELSKFMKFENGIPLLDERLFAEYCQLLLRNYSVVTKLKQCQNLEYQCSDWSGWRASRAKEILDTCIGKLLGQLEGYDAAPWGIS